MATTNDPVKLEQSQPDSNANNLKWRKVRDKGKLICEVRSDNPTVIRVRSGKLERIIDLTQFTGKG
jgi:hypothetical protein